MAETLTYDAGTDTVTTEENLNENEQESLQVGEEMEQQQEALLAGKYKDAQELEKAYVELEKKLGSPEKEEPKAEEKSEESKETKEEEVQQNILDKLWNQREGGFEEETLKELADKRPGELAKMYMEFRNEAAKNEPKALTEDTVDRLKAIAGPGDSYKKVMDWAEGNVSENEIKMFDYVIERGDPASCFFAVQSLVAKYNDATGVDGKLVTGKPPSTKGDVFKSQAEMVKAMEDSRYNDDPGYRQEIIEKLERSDINF